jgi:hypothetical protein
MCSKEKLHLDITMNTRSGDTPLHVRTIACSCFAFVSFIVVLLYWIGDFAQSGKISVGKHIHTNTHKDELEDDKNENYGRRKKLCL